MAIVITLEVDDKGTAKIKKFSNETDKDLSKVEKKGNALNKSLGAGFDKVGKAAFSATTAVAKFALELGTVSIVAGATAIALVTKEASALEQKMDFLGAVLKDKTEAGFASLSETVLELGANTEWMSTQVAEAGEQLAKAGFSTQEVIGALPGTLSLATAGTLALSEAANISASTMRAFGIEAGEASKVADVLAFTATNTNTTVQTIGDAMRYVAPLARTAGITLQETSAAIGLLGNVGIQASMAGTTLRAALASLLTPTKEQSDLMKELGLNVLNSDGNLVSLTEVIRQLESAGANTADMLDLFGRRGGPGMAALLSQGSEALSNFVTETENAGGTAERVAEEKLDNFRGQMTLLRSATQNFMVALGDPMLPLFSDMIKVNVIPAVQSMVEWVKNNQEQIKAFGQNLVAFFQLAGEAISSFISFMQSTGIPIIATIFKTVGDTVGFVSAMIVTVIDTLSWLGDQFNKLPEPIQSVMNKILPLTYALEGISEANTGLRDSIENVGVSAISMGDNLSNMTMKVSDLTFGLQQSAETAHKHKEAIDENTTSTSTLAETVEGELTPALMDTQIAFEDAQRQANMLGEEEYNLQNTTSSVVDNMNNNINSLSDSWDGVTNSIGNTNSALDDLNKTATTTGGGISDTGGTETYSIQATGQDVKDYYDWLSSVSPWVTAFGDGGLVTKPSLGLLAEKGPEVVMPLSDLDEFYFKAAQEGARSDSINQVSNIPNVINLQLMLDGKVLAEEIIDLNEKNISGMKDTFTPLKPNIRNSQEFGV
jgi:TP901 family phage tail tape measure protein